MCDQAGVPRGELEHVRARRGRFAAGERTRGLRIKSQGGGAGSIVAKPAVYPTSIVRITDCHASLVGRGLAPRPRQRLEVVRVGERVRTSDDEYKRPHFFLEVTVHNLPSSPALVDLVVVFVGRTAASAPTVDHRDDYE